MIATVDTGIECVAHIVDPIPQEQNKTKIQCDVISYTFYIMKLEKQKHKSLYLPLIKLL